MSTLTSWRPARTPIECDSRVLSHPSFNHENLVDPPNLPFTFTHSSFPSESEDDSIVLYNVMYMGADSRYNYKVYATQLKGSKRFIIHHSLKIVVLSIVVYLGAVPRQNYIVD